jgi:hypothetical protein
MLSNKRPQQYTKVHKAGEKQLPIIKECLIEMENALLKARVLLDSGSEVRLVYKRFLNNSNITDLIKIKLIKTNRVLDMTNVVQKEVQLKIISGYAGIEDETLNGCIIENNRNPNNGIEIILQSDISMKILRYRKTWTEDKVISTPWGNISRRYDNNESVFWTKIRKRENEKDLCEK